MRLLLCAATHFEIEATITFLNNQQEFKNKIDVLITGIGLTAATYQITRRILSDRPRFILQAGICGSLDNYLSPGDIVVVEKESIGDLGVMEKKGFSSVFNMGHAQLNEEPWTNGKLCNNISVLKKTELTIVDGVTINEITTNLERINFYKEKIKANIETMEGAALHYVCLSEKIPFLQLRSVSNYVGERDKNKWALREAIANLNIELQKMLIKLFST
jgi:futalosine hydrolase